MLIQRIDHVQLVAPSLAEAAAPFERLGLRLTPAARHRGTGTENRAFFVGEGTGEFYVELLGIAGAVEARASETGRRVLRHTEAGGGLKRLLFAVGDMAAAAVELARRGLRIAPYEVFAEDGRKISVAASLGAEERLGFEGALVEYPEDLAARRERHSAARYFDHAFPLKRLDHLAVLAPDMETTTRAWVELLGVPVAGAIAAPDVVIRQMRVGDAIVELLGPVRPESPLAGRPPGLLSMAAFEVDGLDAAVQLARARGFTVSEPEKGVIPGTRRATIAAGEMGGIALQLLEYV